MNDVLFELHLTVADVENGVEHVLASPGNNGTVEMIVARPEVNKRTVLTEAQLDTELGLVGDNWLDRGSSRTGDGKGHPQMQLNVMNYRFAELVAGSRDRVPLAGDQLFVDLDLSPENLPPGTQLLIGSAIIEVTPIPHLGCRKFVERFGLEAMKFANSEFGRRHNLRGINAKVVSAGAIFTGAAVSVLFRNK
jgi:MOSC domain-containing protein YiiM